MRDTIMRGGEQENKELMQDEDTDKKKKEIEENRKKVKEREGEGEKYILKAINNVSVFFFNGYPRNIGLYQCVILYTHGGRIKVTSAELAV